MWFDVVKNQQLEIEGISRENLEGVKSSLGKILDKVKNYQDFIRINQDDEKLAQNMDRMMGDLEYKLKTMLELLNVSENIQFEDQMRGKE